MCMPVDLLCVICIDSSQPIHESHVMFFLGRTSTGSHCPGGYCLCPFYKTNCQLTAENCH